MDTHTTSLRSLTACVLTSLALTNGVCAADAPPSFRKLTRKEGCGPALESLVDVPSKKRENDFKDRLELLNDRIQRGEEVSQADILLLSQDSGYERLEEPAQIHLRSLQFLERLRNPSELPDDPEALFLNVYAFYIVSGSANKTNDLMRLLFDELSSQGHEENARLVRAHLDKWLTELGINVPQIRSHRSARARRPASMSRKAPSNELHALQVRAIYRSINISQAGRAARAARTNRPCHQSVAGETEHQRLQRISKCFLIEELRLQRFEELSRYPSEEELQTAYRELLERGLNLGE